MGLTMGQRQAVTKTIATRYRRGMASPRSEARDRGRWRLATDLALRPVVQAKLEIEWSPEQIAAHLRSAYPDQPGCTSTHVAVVLDGLGRHQGTLHFPATRLAIVIEQGRLTVEQARQLQEAVQTLADNRVIEVIPPHPLRPPRSLWRGDGYREIPTTGDRWHSPSPSTPAS